MTAAMDIPHWSPRDSRKLPWTVAGSLTLHAVALAVLAPLAGEAESGAPPMLQVRLMETPATAAPAIHAAESPPEGASTRSARRAVVARAAQRPPVFPAVAATPTAAASTAAASTPATTQAAQAAVRANPQPPALMPPDLRAAYLSNPRPPYPRSARRLGLEGRVVLRAQILADGSCGLITVSETSGQAILDDAALQAVKQWHFLPARRGGEPVSAWVEIPINFQLDGRER